MESTAVYTISKPQRFEVGARSYFFVPRSGALLEADPESLALLDWLEQDLRVDEHRLEAFINRNGHADAARETVKGFFDFGLLEGRKLHQIARPAIAPAPIPVKHFIASVAEACNLRCGYCYADFGHYRRNPDMMDAATAKRYVDLLLAESGGARGLVYTFFGGEPLLNFPVIQETIAYARGREAGGAGHIQFGLTTNGTLLTPQMIDFCVGEDVEVTVSIDGTRSVNDALRPLAGGGGSYDLLASRVTPLLKRRPTPARVTVTNQNLDLEETFDALMGLGFYEAGFSPVSSADPRYALSRADRERFVDSLASLSERTISQLETGRVLGFTNLLQLLRQLHEAERHDHPCGAGMSLIAGNSKGELYACHRLINDDEFHLGSLERGVDRERQADHLERLHVDHKAPCSSCWAEGLCGGGCYAVAKTETGASESVPWEHCDSIRRWYRVGIEAYLRVTHEHPVMLPRIVRASRTQETYETSPA